MTKSQNPFDMFKMMSENPFMQGMQGAQTKSPLEQLNMQDMSRSLGNASQFVSKAMSMSADNTKAILGRIAEIGQNSAKKASESAKQNTAAPNVETLLSNQAHMIQEMVSEQMDNVHELAEMSSKSALEAIHLLKQATIKVIQDGSRQVQQNRRKATA